MLILLNIWFLGILAANGQTKATVDKDGNLKAIETQVAKHDSITGKVLLKKDVAYEVFKGKRGGLYYWRKSRNGNWYKAYIKVEETVTGTL
jgi:hypothetical protein